ncbi:hypothetical protein MTR67_006797 [Solanum verrucosum]|uniref:DUF7746 domain-containing protein n=1 Tax=Solanum verrucosum TaxID=315347 RepID=A0AAF0PYX6_SOLVR|nr:hypothetical protein MTR67_006797 [Solanum verrucosum]
MIIVGFTGQLRDWWDSYMSIKAKAAVVNSITDNEGVDNLGMTLIRYKEDVVYTLVLTILEHFNGRFTNQYETIRSQLNGLRCRHLGESDYDSESSLKNEVDQPESSGNNQAATIYACKCQGDIYYGENDEFYKLQSQFEDMNIHTITSDNVIELLKEFTDNYLQEKIIQFAVNNKASSSNSFEKQKNDFEFEYSASYSLSEVNNRLAKQPVVMRETSFDDLKGEIENLKQEIKTLKQNQTICDHRLTQIESVNSKGKKNIVEENTLAKAINFDSRQNMFLEMMQIVTAHKWYVKCTILIDNTFSITEVAMIDSEAEKQKGDTFASIAKDDIDDIKSYEKDKDDALETPRRPITRSQTKEFNDKLNGLQSLIQRFLIGEEELKPKGEELSKCYNYLVAQIQAQDEEF